MAIKNITYIYHDPDNTALYWQGYSEDFDDAVTSVADKIAEQYNLRAAGMNKAERYVFDQSLMISEVGGGGGSVNIFNSDGTLDEDRLFTGDGFNLTLDDFANVLMQSSDGAQVALDLDEARLRGARVILENIAGTDLLTLDSDGRAATLANVITWWNSTIDTNRGGVAINLIWGVSSFNADLVVFPHQTNRGVEARFYVPNTERGYVYVGPSNSLITPGIELYYDDLGGTQESGLQSGHDMILKTSGATGSRVIALRPRGGATGFEVRQNAGGVPLTDFLMVGLRIYTSVALAQADATLPIDGLYMVTTEVFGLADNTVKRKV